MRTELALSQVYRLLEPGPVVLLTTAQDGRANVMAMSWHMMMEFQPVHPGGGQGMDRPRPVRPQDHPPPRLRHLRGRWRADHAGVADALASVVRRGAQRNLT